jgi:hypothetical protein
MKKVVFGKPHYRYNWTFRMWIHDGRVHFHHNSLPWIKGLKMKILDCLFWRTLGPGLPGARDYGWRIFGKFVSVNDI